MLWLFVAPLITTFPIAIRFCNSLGNIPIFERLTAALLAVNCFHVNEELQNLTIIVALLYFIIKSINFFYKLHFFNKIIILLIFIDCLFICFILYKLEIDISSIKFFDISSIKSSCYNSDTNNYLLDITINYNKIILLLITLSIYNNIVNKTDYYKHKINYIFAVAASVIIFSIVFYGINILEQSKYNYINIIVWVVLVISFSYTIFLIVGDSIVIKPKTKNKWNLYYYMNNFLQIIRNKKALYSIVLLCIFSFLLRSCIINIIGIDCTLYNILPYVLILFSSFLPVIVVTGIIVEIVNQYKHYDNRKIMYYFKNHLYNSVTLDYGIMVIIFIILGLLIKQSIIYMLPIILALDPFVKMDPSSSNSGAGSGSGPGGSQQPSPPNPKPGNDYNSLYYVDQYDENIKETPGHEVYHYNFGFALYEHNNYKPFIRGFPKFVKFGFHPMKACDLMYERNKKLFDSRDFIINTMFVAQLEHDSTKHLRMHNTYFPKDQIWGNDDAAKIIWLANKWKENDFGFVKTITNKYVKVAKVRTVNSAFLDEKWKIACEELVKTRFQTAILEGSRLEGFCHELTDNYNYGDVNLKWLNNKNQVINILLKHYFQPDFYSIDRYNSSSRDGWDICIKPLDKFIYNPEGLETVPLANVIFFEDNKPWFEIFKETGDRIRPNIITQDGNVMAKSSFVVCIKPTLKEMTFILYKPHWHFYQSFWCKALELDGILPLHIDAGGLKLSPQGNYYGGWGSVYKFWEYGDKVIIHGFFKYISTCLEAPEIDEKPEKNYTTNIFNKEFKLLPASRIPKPDIDIIATYGDNPNVATYLDNRGISSTTQVGLNSQLRVANNGIFYHTRDNTVLVNKPPKIR